MTERNQSEFQEKQQIFLFSKTSRPAPGTNQPPIQEGPGIHPKQNQPGHEAYHSSTCSAKVKNEWH